MKQIKIYGLGGQGVVTAAEVFSEAVAIIENRFAQAIPAYGHERRGAPVFADIFLDDRPIKLKSFVYHPDCVVIFDLSVIEKGINVTCGTTKHTTFIVNAPDREARVPFANHPAFFVDARSIALETIKRDIPNSAMLGAMAGAGLVGIESIKSSIQKTLKPGGLNALAAQRAYQEVRAAFPRIEDESLVDALQDGDRPEVHAKRWEGPVGPGLRKRALFGPVATEFASSKTGSWRVVRPSIDLKGCTYCRICENYCPADVITVERSERKTFRLDYDYCKGCGICANVCPKQCVTMVLERDARACPESC